MPLLSLNDDVLLLVFSLLHPQDALHTCLTCKKAYHLAIPRVAYSVQCWSPVRLRRLCEYYLSSDPFTGTLRAKYLENLTIHATAFEPERSVSDSQDLNPDDVDDLELEFVGTDFAQAHLLGELLVHALNIRELSLDRFHPLVRKEPRISLAFAAMNQLAHVRLAMVGDGTLDVLRHLQNPKRLTFSYHTLHDDLLDEPKTLPPLLSALASFPNLHTLKLWNFTPPHPNDTVALPLLPPIRYLRLSQSSVPALDMVHLCPNLDTLVFSVDTEEGDVVASSGPRWCSLRRLMLASPDMAVCVVDRLDTVHLLQVSGTLPIRGTPQDDDPTSQFLELLRVASPVGLYASLWIDEHGFSSPFWKDVRPCAPRLRCLELKLQYSAVRGRGYGDEWLGRLLADVFRHIGGLLLLKIFIPQTVPPLTVIIPGEMDADVNVQAREGAKKREMERVRAVAALPGPLVYAIPSLRYLYIADMAPNPAFQIEDSEWGDDATQSDRGEDRTVYEWDELREVEIIRKQRWWKILKEYGQRRIVEISEDEGERAQRMLESQGGDVEEMAQIEGECILLFLLCRLLTGELEVLESLSL